MSDVRITPEQARTYLVGQMGLRQTWESAGADGARAVLKKLRVIQLDPLDRVGTNADLVAMARVDGLAAGDVYDAILGADGFEHFAKERCLLPASAFPYYRNQSIQTPWWHLSERLKKVPPEVIEHVYDEVAERGPIGSAALSDQGRVVPIDWSGWKGTSKAATMALQILWTQCRIVVAGREGRNKLYDLPERALGAAIAAAQTDRGDFARWALLERIEACGLLSVNSGPQWSMLRDTRKSDLPQQLVDEGLAVYVTVEGAKRRYLAPTDFRERIFPDDDGLMRILGPLDPLLWDRKLVHHVFGFEYIWEVYKPAAKRRWGYYVCPILHDGQLVGRFEGRRGASGMVVDTLWRENERAFDDAAWAACVARHGAQLGL